MQLCAKRRTIPLTVADYDGRGNRDVVCRRSQTTPRSDDYPKHTFDDFVAHTAAQHIDKVPLVLSAAASACPIFPQLRRSGRPQPTTSSPFSQQNPVVWATTRTHATN